MFKEKSGMAADPRNYKNLFNKTFNQKESKKTSSSEAHPDLKKLMRLPAARSSIAWLESIGDKFNDQRANIINQEADLIDLYNQARDFEIIKLRDGEYPAILTINGFLSEGKNDYSDWRQGFADLNQDRLWLHLEWGAQNRQELQTSVESLEQSNKIGQILDILNSGLRELIDNWKTALENSIYTGLLLADYLKNSQQSDYILIGHSLGCRVIHCALQSLSSEQKPVIDSCYLLGGAVESDKDTWYAPVNAVKNRIHNFYSDYDDTLKFIYRLGNILVSKNAEMEPIGLNRIADLSSISNYDVSDIINNHLEYKQAFHELIERSKD